MAEYDVYIGDFETTVYENQDFTEVWASAVVKIDTEDVKIFNSIHDTFKYYYSLTKNKNIIVYYHNLRFDGQFIMDYLIRVMKLKQAETHDDSNVDSFEFLNYDSMPNDSFIYNISDMGDWYNITCKFNDNLLIIRDSLKLLPFSVAEIGRSFNTKHQKLTMEYEGYRYSGCEITEEEKKYIANDVLVVKEAIELLLINGHKKSTIGSCCLEEFKKTMHQSVYKENFPNMVEEDISNFTAFPENTAEDFIRKSYRGGWCYLCEEKENKIYENGITVDVNSLYPSMMHSQSGNYYPIGKPLFWEGDYIPEEALKPNRFYFIRIKTRFYLKEGKLPFIQIKGNPLYNSTESLKTSDVYDPYTSTYMKFLRDGESVIPTTVELTLTMMDFNLIKEHYYLVDFEIIGGCVFWSMKGIFDDYINKYMKIKIQSKGGARTLAKLFLNNLYGKMATGTYSNFRVAYLKEDETIGYFTVKANNKKPIYIPIGSAITSYARCFTIKSAQANFYGNDKRGFIYADTDSIHCDLTPEELKGIPIHQTDFCCWKIECRWDYAFFTRQKTYIEHQTHSDEKKLDTPKYDIKCSGMPTRCKQIFIDGLNDGTYTIADFTIGLCLEGKLLPKRIKGGVVLTETTYEMR